jgi:hypothetical protein
LKHAQNLVAAHTAGAEFFQQLNHFGNRHNQIICALVRRSRQIYRGGDLWPPLSLLSQAVRVVTREKFNGDAGTAISGWCKDTRR